MRDFRIDITALKKSFTRPVLRGIDLQITNGDYVAIVGKSGSGKTTLLNIVGLVEHFDSGTYIFNNTHINNHKDYSGLRLSSIGFVFQSYNLIPTLNSRENILLSTLYNKKIPNLKERYKDLVAALDIESIQEQNVQTLSGGEKQRVAIARALLPDPCLILADEPTGNLDIQNKDIIMGLLRSEQKKGRAILLITHDARVAQEADRRLRLEGGVLHAE
ncbi:MAG: ABC transporter ATP-binding protein [Bacillota bacterium]|jgi:ABC-type lipoprotein export system ATPase subunit